MLTAEIRTPSSSLCRKKKKRVRTPTMHHLGTTTPVQDDKEKQKSADLLSTQHGAAVTLKD